METLKKIFVVIDLALKHVYIVAAFALAGYVAIRLLEPKKIANEVRTKTDTVREIHHYHVEPNTQPINITIQQKPDQSYRKEAEKKDIITGVQMKGNKLDVQTVDTAGVVSDKKFTLDEGSKVTITPEGVEEKKKTKAGKFLAKAGKTIERGLAAVGIAAIAIVTIMVETKKL